MYPKILFASILIISLFSGCAATKEEVGDYVKNAVVESVEKSIDKKLAERGLSINDIKSAIDTNHDGKITSSEVVGALKDTAKDVAVAEAQKLVDTKLAQLQAQVASTDSTSGKIWYYGAIALLTLISGYLHKSRDSRIAALEKLIGIDVDGDDKVADDSPKTV